MIFRIQYGSLLIKSSSCEISTIFKNKMLYCIFRIHIIDRSMHTPNYLAGRSKVSFKNHAIEHPGKGMKPRHIPAKV